MALINSKLVGVRITYNQKLTGFLDQSSRNLLQLTEARETSAAAFYTALELHLGKLYTAQCMSRPEGEVKELANTRRQKRVLINRPTWKKFLENAGRVGVECPMPEGHSPTPLAMQNLLGVHIYDSPAMGSAWSRMIFELLEDACKEAQSFPETFIGVVLAPNVAEYNSKIAGAAEAILKGQDEISDKLKEATNEVLVKQIFINYVPGTIRSPVRKRAHPIIVFESSMKDDATGKLLS